MEEKDFSPGPPLFKSFLVVAGGYAFSMAALVGAGLAILATVYPDSFAILTSPDKDQFVQALENNPEDVLPSQFLYLMLGINALLCFLTGYLVAWGAPFGKFAHGVFLAVVLFVSFLQQAAGAKNSGIQTILILFMGLSPMCALLGARLYLRQWLNKRDPN